MAYTYNYRILMASWGVAINLTADYFDISLRSANSIDVSSNIALDVTVKHLTTEETGYLLLGLKKVVNLIEAKLKNSIVIKITDINFNECDYQEEGLACAIIGWASHEFSFPYPDCQVYFDKKVKKYVFDL